MPVFQIGERIATPVCGLVRNDVVVTMVQTELFDKSEFEHVTLPSGTQEE